MNKERKISEMFENLISKIQVTDDSCGIGDVPGFAVAGTACDIRGKQDAKRLDLALIYSKSPCTAAGTFTTNDVKAAPVVVSQSHLRNHAAGRAEMRGIVASSGNANACTGERGMKDANEMCDFVAKMLSRKSEEFFVCSTGRIGVNLPMGKIEDGMRDAVRRLAPSPEESARAAEAILTSDTHRKTCTVRFSVGAALGVVGGKTVTIAGMAKGAGMIEPNMATMFGLLATDAKISQELLQKCLWRAVGQSFNCVSVDGDMSTNDTVLILANGESGAEITESDPASVEIFREALEAVCMNLAKKIVGDGEKISRVVTLHVEGARSDAEANKIARSIGNSLLVKASWCGGDPNWGRILCSAGYAKCGIDQTKIDLFYGDVPVFLKGELQADNAAKWREIVGKKEFDIVLRLNLGTGKYRLISTDLTEAYVDFNKGE
ncbi:MAG: bifunctional glutamate N-acetyltransferase/amino-acid acetyltransferase ArgJ [Opitutae bacterium]|nr:bifunctional glutamate N-acetyltransferase/amino-acid acetyltransferase ArgJ [Opitutae bacterium]